MAKIHRARLVLEAEVEPPPPPPPPEEGDFGLPLCVFSGYSNATNLQANVQGVFDASLDAALTISTATSRINAARTQGMKIILFLTGGNHKLNYADGVNKPFHLPTWKDRMDVFDANPAFKTLVASAIADGTVIGLSIIDEPHHHSWETSSGGVVLTKPVMDEMAAYTKAIFPTAIVGISGGGRPNFRTHEHYEVLDYVQMQFSWITGGTRYTTAEWNDICFDLKAADGVAILQGLNVLDGGFRIDGCPIPQTGGTGTFSINCRMTPGQLDDYSAALCVSGISGFNFWRYDSTFMSKAENRAKFTIIRNRLALLPYHDLRRAP